MGHPPCQKVRGHIPRPRISTPDNVSHIYSNSSFIENMKIESSLNEESEEDFWCVLISIEKGDLFLSTVTNSIIFGCVITKIS